MRVEGGTVQAVRLAVNGVAPYPMRLDMVEQAVVGQRQSEEVAANAGIMAIQRARPLRHNDYKVPLMRNLVRRALRETA
jgi:xanthine dehydrogenase YagS FAD-binding subunit